MTYGYARISTPKQSIDRQIRNIKASCPSAVIVQEAYTGTKIVRDQWNKLTRKLHTGDSIIFDSVSRMSRNADEGYAAYETEQKLIIRDYQQRLSMQGLSWESYIQYTGLTLDRMMEQVRPQAEDRIKSRLVLQAVADAEGMTVTDEDRQKEYESMAEAYQLEVDKVREMLEAKGLKEMDKDLLIKKAMDFITDNAKEV